MGKEIILWLIRTVIYLWDAKYFFGVGAIPGPLDKRLRLSRTQPGSSNSPGKLLSETEEGTAIACDLLFLYPSPIYRVKMREIVQGLRARGMRVEEFVLELDWKKLLFSGQYSRPECSFLEPLYLEHAQAAFIAKAFQPKVVATFLEWSPLSVTLREQFNRKKIKLINIAHSVTGESEHFRYFDFDYYFVFGPSSFDAARKHPQRVGETKMIPIGNPFFSDEVVSVLNREKDVFLFCSDGFRFDLAEQIRAVWKQVSEWRKTHPEYTLWIKPHPLEDTQRLREVFGEKAQYVDRKTSLDEALTELKPEVVLTGWSNSSLESARLAVPVICVNPTETSKSYLELDQFFGEPAKTVGEIDLQLKKIRQDPAGTQKTLNRFVDRHLRSRTGAQTRLIDALIAVSQGHEPIEESVWIGR